MLRCKLGLILCTALFAAAFATSAAEPVRIAVISGFDSPLEDDEELKVFRGIAELVNAKGGVLGGRQIQIVPFDSKFSPQESVQALNQAIEQNIAFVASTTSSIVHALSRAVAEHNAAHPDRRVLLLNYGAKDPALTQANCSFWHFRLTSHTDMDLNLLTDYIARRNDVHKVYLMNPDYAYGHSVSKASKQMLAKKRPDIQIVGDDLVPLLKVKDFAPYVAKIKASGADTVITGNWGEDLTLFLKAGVSAPRVSYYVTIPTVAGTAAGIKTAEASQVTAVFDWHANADSNPYAGYNAEYRAKYKALDNFDYILAFRTVEMLAQAIDTAQSLDPAKVAYALEGMKYAGASGPSWIRAEDHQLIAPIYLATFVRAGQPGVQFDEENTGSGWKTVARIDAMASAPQVNCTMQRPQR